MIQLSINFPFHDGLFDRVRAVYKEKEYARIQAENAYLRKSNAGLRGHVQKLRINKNG